MNPRACVVFVLAFAVVASSAPAVEYPGFERVLVPLAFWEPVPGVNGSVWVTDLWIGSSGGNVIFLNEPKTGCLACPAISLVQPGQGGVAKIGRNAMQVPGQILFVESDTAHDAMFNLRVRDISRTLETAGTEVPVIRQSGFRSDVVALPNVPLDARFRNMVRVYDVDSGASTAFNIQFVNDTTGALLGSHTVVAAQDPSGWSSIPSVAQVGVSPSAFPELAGLSAVRIVIRPAAAGTRYWAFMSVTNNETQDVTLVTPQ